MLIVTGANGKLGGLVVRALLKRIPAAELGVSVRDPDRARELEGRGVRVRRADFDDAASLAHALEGATRVLVISANSTGETAVRQNLTAIEAAKAVGARRVLYTSHQGASSTSFFPPMLTHAACELALQSSGVAFTALRNGFYADVVSMMLGAALTTGELAAPEDGPVAWTAHADVAEAAAIALGEESLDGVTAPLTGAEAFDLEGIAAIAAELAGRPIRRVVVAESDYQAALVAKGAPEARASMMVGLFAASRRGDFARVDPTLARVIGRPPTPLREILKATIAASR